MNEFRVPPPRTGFFGVQVEELELRVV